VHKGDPISPYLFLSCIERLFHLINITIDRKVWTPIQLSRGGLKIFYLGFVDDLLLFAEANVNQAEVLKKVLSEFCMSLGKIVNIEKTRIFFSPNVHWQLRDQIMDKLGYQRTTNLGKYLGVPLHHERASEHSYKFLLDKVTGRLPTYPWREGSV